jgi:hypothetical protein
MAAEPSLDFESDPEPGRAGCHVFQTFSGGIGSSVLSVARRSANAGFILALGVTAGWQLQRNPAASKMAVNLITKSTKR